MKYTDQKIIRLFEETLDDAREKLSGLKVAEGRVASANISGWIFEQTIRYCLTRELKTVGLQPPMRDQVSMGGRVKVDLLVGNIAVELKVGGSFGAGDAKYETYRKTVEGRNWIYFYLTLQEGHAPYRKSTNLTFGKGRAFFLDTPGDWKRFVDSVIANVSERQNLYGGLGATTRFLA